MNQNWLNYKRFHLVGIKGVGMTALALILQDLGKQVTGSDVGKIFLTDSVLKDRAIKIYNQFDEANIKNAQVVIFSGSHLGKLNPEVIKARENGLLVISLSKALGFLSQQKQTIAVCGCHGKTTTSALTAFIGENLKLNFSYYIGAPGFMDYLSGKWDKGKYFVTEADEYVIDPKFKKVSKFLNLKPKYIICTNIDFDHPDVFLNLESVRQSYLQFFQKLAPAGKLIINGDDAVLKKTVQQSGKPFITYGISLNNDYQLKSKKKNKYILIHQNQEVAELNLTLLGEHNALNSVAVILLFNLLGFSFKRISSEINKFKGVKRRMEFCGKANSNYIYDDYAHHPNEIKATLIGFKKAFPNHKLALIFQPHTFTRTQVFLKQFSSSLNIADAVSLMPIFKSAREIKADYLFSSSTISKDLNLRFGKKASIIKQDKDIINFIKKTQKQSNKWLYITMGAGDVYLKNSIIFQTLNEN